ncbi:hypothetical protein B566_EDAN015600 [Ephemera danica]|nr:hypothetical protein B566_EDAN015600 [Ephemera danica]
MVTVFQLVMAVLCKVEAAAAVVVVECLEIWVLEVPDMAWTRLKCQQFLLRNAPNNPYSVILITPASTNEGDIFPVGERSDKTEALVFGEPMLAAGAEILADSGLEEFTPGVLELNDAITSLSLVGLDLPSLDLTQANRNASIHLSMPHALTSHLQTFGCTVVIGLETQEVNDFIKFLGLFLDDHAKYSSMLIRPPGHNCFHAGLHLQGLLLDAFGYREISSLDLASNLYPVTVIDLSRPVDEGGVKQSHPYHHHLVLQYERNKKRAGTPQVDFITNSLLHPVEESSKLICALLFELSVLPNENWQQHICYFKTKLLNMAQLFISYIFRISTTFTEKLFQTTIDKFKKSLNLGDADFLLILANCEKLKPGFFSYIIYGSC